MKALIISLNFHPGHVSHMVASYKQCEELGYESYYYADSKFESYLPSDGRCVKYGMEPCPKGDIAIFLFPSQKNLLLIKKLKSQGVKVLYIFHEPLAPMGEYHKAGFSYKYLAKLWVINLISSLTVKWSDIILLPSEKAVDFYKNNALYKNLNFHYLPLMYDDEWTERFVNIKRKYFSYIGTVAADHSFQEYLDFVCWAVEKDKVEEVDFMIATKSTFDVPKNIINSSRVKIKQGRPLTDEEINECYASAYVVWNAYARTTQSGVLAKSFMFGTPAVVLKKNSNEFAHDGVEVVAVEDNSDKEEMVKALNKIVNNYTNYSQNCRQRFLESFYYQKYNNEFKKLIGCKRWES